MEHIPRHLEEKIAFMLPEKFALVFDGWSTHDTHYVAVFETYPLDVTDYFLSVLLALSPLQRESNQSVDEHVVFIRFVINVFWKTI